MGCDSTSGDSIPASVFGCIQGFEGGGGVEQGAGGKSPFSLFSEPISPSSLLFEPISPSSLNVYVPFFPSSLLFPPISPSSQLCLGHFSLLTILFLPPHFHYHWLLLPMSGMGLKMPPPWSAEDGSDFDASAFHPGSPQCTNEGPGVV